MIERILSRVERVTESGCWIYMGSLDGTGYGRIQKRKRSYATHRVTYEHFKGQIPDGLQIDHLCRVRCCCNPDHLEAVTGQVNVLRGQTVPARRAAVTHCPAGHEYTPENTRLSKRRQRSCRACFAKHSAQRVREPWSPRRPAKCHPDRPERSMGLCWACRKAKDAA